MLLNSESDPVSSPGGHGLWLVSFYENELFFTCCQLVLRASNVLALGHSLRTQGPCSAPSGGPSDSACPTELGALVPEGCSILPGAIFSALLWGPAHSSSCSLLFRQATFISSGLSLAEHPHIGDCWTPCPTPCSPGRTAGWRLLGVWFSGPMRRCL